MLRSAGMAVCFATNQEPLRARYLWEDVGLKDHADIMFHSADLGVAKPDAGFFVACEASCGFSKTEIVFVDDTPTNVESAIRAGWRAGMWTGEERLGGLIDRI